MNEAKKTYLYAEQSRKDKWGLYVIENGARRYFASVPFMSECAAQKYVQEKATQLGYIYAPSYIAAVAASKNNA